MRNLNTMTVSGVADVEEVFDRIESGKYQSVDFIEAYICPGGCVSGCFTIEGRYIAQRSVQRISRRLSDQPVVKEERIRALLRERFFDLEGEIKARPVQRIARDLKQAVAWKREQTALLEQLPRKDCGACGCPDCETLAEDALRNEATVDDCVFVRIGRLEAQASGAERKRDE
jgi:iron only hydrogenase large subunit-like protein